MKVNCPSCENAYNLPEEKLPKGKKIKFPCPSCKNIIQLDLRDGGEEKAEAQETAPADLKERIFNSVEDLPPMPQVVQKARQVLSDSNSSFKDLAIIFVTDQAIATRVLKLANSAYYGLSQKVSSIQQASVILGHKTLAELITMVSTSDLLGNDLKGYGMEAGSLWQHSLAVAFGARIIAKKTSPEDTDDAFAAGLIHDSGKLVLDSYVYEKKEAFENYMAKDQHGFLAAEKAILGLDHAEIAAEVCKKWNVPENIAIAIQHHHHPAANEDCYLANVLHVADGIAMMGGLGQGADAVSYEIEESAMSTLNLKSNDISAIMDQVVASVQNTIKEYQ